MRSLPRAIAELVAERTEARRLGAFALLRQLGHGGFAPVWLADEEYAGRQLRTVAIKLFSLPVDSDEAVELQTRQVLEEARTLCRVEHPNVVRFHSVVIDRERGVAGFAMEHLAGPSLDQVLGERGRFSVADAIDVGIAICSALAAVHRAGIVHRDVKPANIIHTPAGYKLIDFGIALGAREAAARPRDVVEALDLPLEEGPTRHSTFCVRSTSRAEETMEFEVLAGTVGYMAPECVTRSAPSNRASDLYALGATLFELVSGRVPAAHDGAKMRGDIMDGRRRPPYLDEVVGDDVDEGFAELVHQLLAPTREERPQSADWVLSKLEQLRYSLGSRNRELPDEEHGPFRGLARFEASDRGVYFGRSLEIGQALHVLRVRGLVALLGPSGSGKSSLASAGVLPAIEDGLLQLWPPEWDTLSLNPGHDPRAALLGKLGELASLGEEPAPREVVTALGARAQSSGRGLTLLVDQLEELAAVSAAESREWLIEFIEEAAENAVPGLRVVVTLRRDMLDSLLEFASLGRLLLRNAVLIEPMSGVTWAEVLDQALSAYDYRVEDEALRKELVREIGRTASAMPLVGFALSRLWEMRDREAKVITWESLRALGGIAGALAQHAENTLQELRRSDPAADVARRVLLALTTPHGTRTARTQAELRDVAGDESDAVISALEQARILERTPAGLTLAHEVLLAEWQTLRGWVSEARESRVLAEELEQDAERHAVDPDGAPLWQRRRLVHLRDVLGRNDVRLSDRAQEFLRASERVVRRRRLLTGALSAVAVVGIGAATTAYLVVINAEKGRTQAALESERSSRHLAEQRMREVQTAQARIDELLRGVQDSSTKEAVLALQRQIRDPSEVERAPRSAAARAPEAARRAAAPEAAAAAPAPAASVPKPELGIKVQSDW